MEYRESKWEKKVLRGVPVDAIEPWIAADERSRPGLWCLVAGWPSWVPPDGAEWITMGRDNDPVEAQIARWLRTQPDRIHDTRESAVAFVRSRLGEPSP